jgi:hypothetical protein
MGYWYLLKCIIKRGVTAVKAAAAIVLLGINQIFSNQDLLIIFL